MKEESVTLSSQEQRRLMVLNQVGSGLRSGEQAAGLLGISERQLRRLRRAYIGKGAAALAHGNRGRWPANDQVISQMEPFEKAGTAPGRVGLGRGESG